MGCGVVARSSAFENARRVRAHARGMGCDAHIVAANSRGGACVMGCAAFARGHCHYSPSAEFRDASTRPRARAAWGAHRDTIRGGASVRHGVRGAARVHGET